MDQNHMISRMDKSSFDGESVKRTLDYQGPSQNHVSSIVTSQVNVKLNDLE